MFNLLSFIAGHPLLDHSLIVGVAWTEHHPVLAKGDRLPVAIGRDRIVNLADPGRLFAAPLG
jgi:hypothetical protein